MAPRILITDFMHESIVEMLEELGFSVDYHPEANRSDILRLLPAYTGLIVRSKTAVDPDLLSAGNRLKFVARSGAGLDLIDLEFAAGKGIAILHAAEGNRDAVAEHTTGMLLALLHQLMKGDREVRRRTWDREGNRGLELMHRCVGIIGYGNMGTAFARRLSGFGCGVLAYDKYKTGFGNQYAEESSLERLFEQADVLSLHVPLTDETRGFYNSAFFSHFHHNLVVINTARGEILPLQDLLREIKSGKVLAAGLDVLEKENFSQLSAREDAVLAELIQLDNVLFTPHVAGWTAESYIKINRALADKISSLGLA